MTARLCRVAGLALALSSPALPAEQFVEQDGFRIHYAAIPVTDVAPQTARAFGLKRSGRYALLVLNAQRLTPDGPVGVPATASGSARNLIGHVTELSPRPVEDGGAHYVIAEFDVIAGEWLVFELSVRPEGAVKPVPLKFRQQFYP